MYNCANSHAFQTKVNNDFVQLFLISDNVHISFLNAYKNVTKIVVFYTSVYVSIDTFKSLIISS